MVHHLDQPVIIVGWRCKLRHRFGVSRDNLPDNMVGIGYFTQSVDSQFLDEVRA